MNVTVAICTWNRADLLDRTLTSLSQVLVPSGIEWQVVVADNNSTDHTEEILRSHRSRLPLRSLFEGRQGKSHALNAIIDELAGDLVLWTDDDVRLDAGWLAAYVDAAQRWPEASFFGGKIVPHFLGEEPTWLRPAWRAIGGVFGERNLGEEPFALNRKRLPFGANMAARVDLQKKYRFDPQLGRVGEGLLAGEETALMQQWLADGYTGMWVPGAVVEHVVTPDRTELEFIQHYYFGVGRSKPPHSHSPGRFLRGLWYFLSAMKYELPKPLFNKQTTPYRWMKCLAKSSYHWGHVASEWRHAPEWSMPRPVRGLLANDSQPRYTGPAIEQPVRTPGPDAASERRKAA